MYIRPSFTKFDGEHQDCEAEEIILDMQNYFAAILTLREIFAIS